MAFIIYHTRAKVRTLARELNVTSHFPNQQRTFRRGTRMSVVVNWGCRGVVIPENVWPASDEAPRILNATVAPAISKVLTFDRLRAAGLPMPRIALAADEISDGGPFYMRGKYLGRKDGLTGGAGITIYEKGQMPAAGTIHDFFSQVVSKAHEVRIHVGDGNILCEQFKLFPAGSGTGILIRNHTRGAFFSGAALHTRIDQATADRGREIAIKAIAAVGLDFGAVDMALTKRGEWVIFEVNTAPGLTQRVIHDERAMPCTYDAYKAYFETFIRRI